MDFFRELEGRPTLRSVNVGGVEVEKGSRVLLWPSSGGDIMDIALKGKVAFVESIEQDYEDMLMELSAPVLAAVEEAAKLVESLVEEIGREGDKVRSGH